MKQWARWARTAVVGATAVAAAVSTVSITGAGHAAAIASAGCTQYTAVLAPGTWETNPAADPYQPVGMLAPVGDGLRSELGNQVTVIYPPYEASAFDQGASYTQSKSTLVTEINEILSGLCASTQVLLGGYSQGADGMGDVASEIGNDAGPISADRVLAVGLLSDPRRDPESTQELGPQQPGHGLAGVRPQGFGALAGKVRTICGEGDLYCSVSESASPFISAIGQTLAGGGDPSTPEGQLSQSLISDFSRADLAGIASTLSTLTDRAGALPTDAEIGSAGAATGVAGVGAGASSVAGTLSPLQDVATFAQENPGAAEALKTAPAGSPEASAAKVLETAGQIDLVGAISSAASLANSASQILAGGAATQGTTGTSPRDTLAPRAEQLATAAAPLAQLDTSTLTQGLSILKLLKPNTIIKQVTNVGTGVAQTAGNMPQILDSFVKLPGAIAAGDIPGAHKLAGDINNLFSPVIKMAAGVDLGLVASVINAASVLDPSGWTAIAGLIVGVLSNLDIIRIANDVGQAQEVLWRAVDKLAKGDLLGAGAEMTGLAPVGIDLAAAVAGMFTGAPKMDPSQLGNTGAVGTQSAALASSVGSGDLAGMASALTGIAGSEGVGDLVDVARQGMEVATFYASNAHTNYQQGGGTQLLLDFLLGQIGG